MEDKQKEIKKSIEDMLKGLQGIVQFTEQSTKNVFESMGKAEAKKFAKTMEQMKFSDNIINLKKEVEQMKKSFKDLK